jgi:hypothetical protein
MSSAERDASGTMDAVSTPQEGLAALQAAAESGELGMRNVLIYADMDVDIDQFLAAIPLTIEQYGRYVRQVAQWLLDRQWG